MTNRRLLRSRESSATMRAPGEKDRQNHSPAWKLGHRPRRLPQEEARASSTPILGQAHPPQHFGDAGLRSGLTSPPVLCTR